MKLTAAPAPSPRSGTLGIAGGLALLALLSAAAVGAQEMEPRVYSNAPVGMNFLVVGYTHSTGGLSTNPASPLQNAHLTVDAPVVAYARVLDAWGKSAKLDVVLPVARLSGTAELDGSLVTREVSGLVDPAFRLSLNFFGAPALRLPEYASYRQSLLLGASFQVSAPLGQYDPDRLVNLGTNRWMLRPEVGASKALGRLILEAAVAASFFTTNHEYYGGKTREQDLIYSVRGNSVVQLRNGAWVSINATYYAGGRSTVDRVLQDDRIASSRVGGILTLPVNRRNSVKLHGSVGVSVRTGTDFNIAGIAWQHRWGGGI